MNLLKRILLPLKRVLDDWLAEEGRQSPPPVPPENSTEREAATPPPPPQTPARIDGSPGITCPRCAHKFPVSIELLLSSPALHCPACNLRLELNREKSQAALEAMEKVWRAVNQPKK